MDYNYGSRHKDWRWIKGNIFQTVMGSWREDSSQTIKMGETQDDEETWGLEGGYSSDRGLSRHSLDYHSGKLGEISSDVSEGEQED
jgi:hypothetical protein